MPSRYLNDQAVPSIETAIQISNSLGISLNDLAGTTHSVKMAVEAPAAIDPWPVWAKQLRSAYQKNPAVVESGVRTAWPRPVAEKILAWLRANPTP